MPAKSKYPELRDREWLRSKYEDEGLTTTDIGKLLGTTAGCVRSAMVHHDIPRRTVSESIALKHPNGRRGKKAGNWKGGRRVAGGYIFLYAPDHPNATHGKPYVQEHRLVMEEKLGRYLEPNEIVHHIDGNKQNNDLENLVVKTNGKHIREHFKASHEAMKLRAENERLHKRIAELERRLENC